MKYVDGYVIAIPRKNLRAYRRIAQAAGKVWRDHGALQYCESAGEDLKTIFGMQFPKVMKARPAETIVFAWVVFKSRAHRDRVNAKVMKDPRLAEMMDPKDMPFDPNRMLYGGFNVIVDA
jgi:uncharacterized protein YbaA (DUF1428 family)